MGEKGLTEGAARLDRIYSWGEISCSKAEYFPTAFSDHLGLLVSVTLPDLSPVVEPNFRPYFKVKPEVATDQRFLALVTETVANWLPAKDKMPLLEWWDLLKSDVKAAAKAITKERKNERKQELSFLMILQARLESKISSAPEIWSLSPNSNSPKKGLLPGSRKGQRKFSSMQTSQRLRRASTLSFSTTKNSNRAGKELQSSNSRTTKENWSRATRNVSPFSKGKPALSLTTWPPWTLKPRTNSWKEWRRCSQKETTPSSINQSLTKTSKPVCSAWTGTRPRAAMASPAWCTWRAGTPSAAPERCDQRNCQGGQVAWVHEELLFGVFFKIGEGELHQNQGQTKALSSPDRLQDPLRNPGWAPQKDRESYHFPSSVLCWLQKGLTSCLSHQKRDRVCERSAVIETDFVSAFDLMTVNWVLMVLRKKGCSEQFVRVLQSIYKDSDTFVSCIINNEVQERILNKKKNIKQGCRRCYE